MKIYTLINSWNDKERQIKAINWETEGYQHVFYIDVDGKIEINSSLATRNWDLWKVEHEQNK
jgi:hypothetical protein